MSSTISKDDFVSRVETMAADFSKKWQARRAYSPDQFAALMLERDWWAHFLRHVEIEANAMRPPQPRSAPPGGRTRSGTDAARALGGGG